LAAFLLASEVAREFASEEICPVAGRDNEDDDEVDDDDDDDEAEEEAEAEEDDDEAGEAGRSGHCRGLTTPLEAQVALPRRTESLKVRHEMVGVKAVLREGTTWPKLTGPTW